MKEFFGAVFVILCCSALVLLIIGLFSPKTALFWHPKPRTRKTSLLIYGLAFLTGFILCGITLPTPADKAAAKADPPPPTAEAKTQPEARPQTGASLQTGAQPESPTIYQIVDEEKQGDGIYLKITIDRAHSRDSIIELTRRLKEQYQAQGIFSCYFYYKKWTKLMTAIAGDIYLKDCSSCAYKDKDGAPIDFPCYNIERSTYDSLKALRFDTAGFKLEAVFLEPLASSKHYILSSADNHALLIEQDPTGAHEVFRLDKKTINGQERFIEALDKHKYFVIDRDSGLINYYSYDELNSQEAIDE